jgi:hypothetical protein
VEAIILNTYHPVIGRLSIVEVIILNTCHPVIGRLSNINLNFFYGYRLNFPVIKKPRYEALSPDGDDPLSLSQSHRNSPQNSLEDDPYEFSDMFFPHI